jgi:hypothetical protein
MDRVSDSGAIRSGLVPQLKHRAPHRAFPRHSGTAEAVPPRWATLGSAWKMPAVKGRRTSALQPSAPRSKADGPSRGRQRCPGFCSGGQCRLPRRDPPNRTVMQALRLRQPRTSGAAPAITRGCAPSGPQWAFAAAFAGPPGSMYLPRCEMHARLRARLEPIGRSPPRRAISSVILVGFTAQRDTEHPVIAASVVAPAFDR